MKGKKRIFLLNFFLFFSFTLTFHLYGVLPDQGREEEGTLGLKAPVLALELIISGYLVARQEAIDTEII